MASDREKKNAQQRARAKANRAAGKCACGRAQFNGTTSCEGCLVAQRESARRRYAKNRERLCAESREWREKNIEQARETQRKRWRRTAEDPEKMAEFRVAHRIRAYKRQFGLSAAQVQQMHEAQAGACDICKRDFAECGGRSPGIGHVDHCHKTGKVRALLCARCNLAVGQLESWDDLGLLTSMCAYILRHRGTH